LTIGYLLKKNIINVLFSERKFQNYYLLNNIYNTDINLTISYDILYFKLKIF